MAEATARRCVTARISSPQRAKRIAAIARPSTTSEKTRIQKRVVMLVISLLGA
jgi:hypothetical protein